MEGTTSKMIEIREPPTGDQSLRWTNRSATKLARGGDPVQTVIQAAREVVLGAIQAGWSGPPFDPFWLAKYLRIPTTAREDVLDARLVLSGTQLRIEFNPNQSRRRIRFSIAHEIAHTLFPDCIEITRNRSRDPHPTKDDWQLELLCNIGAAEILMPTGSDIDPSLPVTAETMLRLQSQFDVSMEAIGNRLANVTRTPFTIVVAARTDDDEKAPIYRIDYAQPSRTSRIELPRGLEIENHVFAQCTAVGYTAKGSERGSGRLPEIDWECIGIPPYPGKKYPRVIGIASVRSSRPLDAPSLVSVRGSALEPRGAGPRIIAQVVNDKTPIWGAGFAKAVAVKYPTAQIDFRDWARKNPKNLSLGNTRACDVSANLDVFSMVAQHGYGESATPRIRYAALRSCLEQLGEYARSRSASVHMPRIGAGYAGGNWSYIAELVDETIVRRGVHTTVYILPDDEPIKYQRVVALTSSRWKNASG
jgi:O-acetyl-ADP-ribose deacetylase (regulator of RNase III)